MKTVSRTLQLVIAVLVVVVGLSAASVRVLFPNADRYRGDLETWLGGIAGQPVAIGSLEAEWRGWRPEFRINDLRVRDRAQRGKDGGVNARFESATVSVDVLASLLGGELRPVNIHVDDVALRVNKATEAAAPDTPLRQHLLALLQWLQSQHNLRLDATRVELSDLHVAGEPVAFTNLYLTVSNGGPAHEIEVAADIPGAQNGALRAIASIRGDATAGDWSGELSLDVNGLNLAAIQAWRDRLGNTDVAGRAHLHLESRWQNGRLVDGSGDVGVSDLRVAGAGGVLGPLEAAALVDVQGGDGDWRVHLLKPSSGFAGLDDPTPLASVIYRAEAGASAARVQVGVTKFAIGELVPLLPVALEAPDALWRQLLEAAPGGELRDLAVDFRHHPGGIGDVRVAGIIHDGSVKSSGGLPALSAVDGEFAYDAGGTRLRLSDGAILASMPDLFPEPLRGEKLKGTLSWSANEGERRLRMTDIGMVTADVSAQASGELLWQADDPVPFVDVSLAFSDGNLARLEHFIPTHTFGEKIGAWLDQAFPRGHIRSGQVTLRGRPPRELMADSPLDVTVLANIEDATVHYLDGWPSTERVTGTVRIADRKLVADVSEAYFYDARVLPGRFIVADILADDPVFEWSPRIAGRTEDALRFLRESPLRQDFRSLLDNVNASGKASLALDFRLPLVSGKPLLTGILDVSANTVTVPSLQRGFSDVAGRVRFDQDGMGGEGVTGDYLGKAVVASIETVPERSGHTRVHLTGSADADYVASHLYNAGLLAGASVEAMPILTRLTGSASWDATIDVLEHAGPGESPVVLRVASDLRGARVALPAPFNKAAGDSVDLAVEARFADAEHRQMHLHLGSLASGIFELRAQGGDYRLDRAGIRLGGDMARLPDMAEINISGRIGETAVGEWSALALKPGGDSLPASDALPTRVDLRVDRLHMLDAQFDNVRVQATGDRSGLWRAAINGTDLDGKVSVPADYLNQPVIAEFNRLVLTPVTAAEEEFPDPRRVPPVRFSCVHCTYDDMQLYDVEVVTSRRSDGLSIDSLRMRNDGFLARASGAWTHADGQSQRTSLDVQLSSDDLGKFLASLGHDGGATRGGVTDVTLSASWDGPPSNFDLEAMDGVMHFRAGEGTLTDVRRGTTGRLFGLLVVPDLPRRLKGDFSDLFEDGFVYKQIEGTFNIERGNAYTNDLTLDGSLARIDIAGRTGLADEDYDQLMTVTPKLSESLPLMPIWLVEKAIQRELFNKMFAYQYSITGSWDKPSVTPIVIENEYPADRS